MLTNVTVTGNFAKSAMAVYNYSSVNGISGSNVNLTGANSLAWDAVLTVDGVEGAYNVSNWGVVIGTDQQTQLSGETASQAADGWGMGNNITGTSGDDISTGGSTGNDQRSGGAGDDGLTGGAGRGSTRGQSL